MHILEKLKINMGCLQKYIASLYVIRKISQKLVLCIYVWYEFKSMQIKINYIHRYNNRIFTLDLASKHYNNVYKLPYGLLLNKRQKFLMIDDVFVV